MAAQPSERGLVIFLQKLCFGFLISKINHAWETSPAHPPTAIEQPRSYAVAAFACVPFISYSA